MSVVSLQRHKKGRSRKKGDFLRKEIRDKIFDSRGGINDLRNFLMLTEEEWGRREMLKAWEKIPENLKNDQIRRELKELKEEIEKVERHLRTISGKIFPF